MTPVADLIKPLLLRELALPAIYQQGKEIVANGGVELEEFGLERIVAHATGGQRRLVEIRSTTKGLYYTCTCSSKLDRPCKHIVATGLASWQKGVKHK